MTRVRSARALASMAWRRLAVFAVRISRCSRDSRAAICLVANLALDIVAAEKSADVAPADLAMPFACAPTLLVTPAAVEPTAPPTFPAVDRAVPSVLPTSPPAPAFAPTPTEAPTPAWPPADVWARALPAASITMSADDVMRVRDFMDRKSPCYGAARCATGDRCAECLWLPLGIISNGFVNYVLDAMRAPAPWITPSAGTPPGSRASLSEAALPRHSS